MSLSASSPPIRDPVSGTPTTEEPKRGPKRIFSGEPKTTSPGKGAKGKSSSPRKKAPKSVRSQPAGWVNHLVAVHLYRSPEDRKRFVNREEATDRALAEVIRTIVKDGDENSWKKRFSTWTDTEQLRFCGSFIDKAVAVSEEIAKKAAKQAAAPKPAAMKPAFPTEIIQSKKKRKTVPTDDGLSEGEEMIDLEDGGVAITFVGTHESHDESDDDGGRPSLDGWSKEELSMIHERNLNAAIRSGTGWRCDDCKRSIPSTETRLKMSDFLMRLYGEQNNLCGACLWDAEDYRDTDTVAKELGFAMIPAGQP